MSLLRDFASGRGPWLASRRVDEAEAESSGRWITADGSHIHLNASGEIDAGPQALVGKTADHLSDKAHEASARADSSHNPEDHKAAGEAHKQAGEIHGALGNAEKSIHHKGESDRHDKSAKSSLDTVSSNDTIGGDAGSGPANEKKKEGQGEKKMETTVEKKWEPKAVPEVLAPTWTVPAGLPGDAARLAGKNLRVRGVIVKDGMRMAEFGEIYIGSKRTNFMARLDNKPQLASDIEKWEKAQREAEQIESENKIGEEDAIRSGRNPIEPVYHDGEYLSGYKVYGVAADFLRDIGAAHDVSGWGTEVEPKLMDELGKSFTYADAQEFTRPHREAKQTLRDGHEREKTAKFREAKETGKPVVLAHWMETRRVKEGGEWGEYQFACTRYAMPDGSTREDAINTY